jgi:hypothetical protein
MNRPATPLPAAEDWRGNGVSGSSLEFAGSPALRSFIIDEAEEGRRC